MARTPIQHMRVICLLLSASRLAGRLWCGCSFPQSALAELLLHPQPPAHRAQTKEIALPRRVQGGIQNEERRPPGPAEAASSAEPPADAESVAKYLADTPSAD